VPGILSGGKVAPLLIVALAAYPSAQAPPPPPPGTVRILNFDTHEGKMAACAETTSPPLVRGARTFPATEVWITDGQAVWKTATPLGTCDPSWAPDGTKLAVTSLDGLWVLSGVQQQQGDRIVEARAVERPATEFDYTAITRPRWSPNGTRIAYLVSNGGTSWVEVVDVASRRRIYKSREETYGFAWGADSRSLVIGGNTVLVP
jgi:dipeptidyl aminopeptidase/acylaminoacyl peptidase